jgi:hypothetical protein
MPSLHVLSHAFRAWRRNLKWRKHEPETPYLADLLSGSPVCLHVGASDGRHSYVMTQVAPRATIYAIEPQAFSYAVLKMTVAWHGIGDRVTPVHAAVGDRAGEMLLVTPRKTTGRMGRAYAFVTETAPMALNGASAVLDRDRPHVLLEIHPAMLAQRFGGSAEQVVALFTRRGYRMFALNGDRLEECAGVVTDKPWKDYFFIHPTRAARLPDGVFKARMAA